MKTNPLPNRGGCNPLRPLTRAIAYCGLAACVLPAHAESVDSELVLLVDVTRPGLSTTEFSRLMDGYATAFTSAEVLDSIQSGALGRIAVSMMFYGNSSTQVTGIPWMMIGNQSQADQFAALARNLTMPFATGVADVGSALTNASFSFGTETGGADNGFQSSVQIIEVATAKNQPKNTASSASTGSAAALDSGVDLINALALGNQANAIDTFYTANVIGSTIDGVSPTSTTAPINGTLAASVSMVLNNTVQTGATASVNAVPEPSAIFGLIPATLLLLKRRRL